MAFIPYYISTCRNIHLSLEHLTVTLTGLEHPSSTGQTDDIACMWTGGTISRMEWLFLGQNTIVPMEFTNSSWDEEEFTCFTKHGDAMLQAESIILKVKGEGFGGA